MRSTIAEPLMRALLDSVGLKQLNSLQVESLARLETGHNLLIVAPTGSGKTEAALLPLCASLMDEDIQGIRAVYITPLRALNRDLTDRIRRLVSGTHLNAAVRHGDTPASERRKQAAHPPDILITTPETLQAILPGKVMQRHLRNDRYHDSH